MAKILVSKHGSEEDRDKQENGILLGEATSYEEFLALVRQGGPAYLRYTDERGERLYYHQVEHRFGVPTYPPRMFDEETGEDY